MTMALHWDWQEMCGEITVVQMHEGEEDREFKLGLYTGNACLIMLHEYKENGRDMYNLFGFFSDKAHMKDCLGLNKKGGYTSNIYNTPYQRFEKIKLNKNKCRYFKDIVAAFAQAFDNLTIEIVNE